MIAWLLLGFSISATATFAIAGLLGEAVRSWWHPPGVVLALLLAVLAMCDLYFPLLRRVMVRRQTRRDLVMRYGHRRGGLMWGLDVGSVVSTFRASAASWCALVLVFAGWGPKWLGLVYALSFAVSLCAVVFKPRSNLFIALNPARRILRPEPSIRLLTDRVPAIAASTRLVAAGLTLVSFIVVIGD